MPSFTAARRRPKRKKYEAERAAEAAKFAKQQEAEGIALVGRAEAEAIRQKGLAEAEAMKQKAEAYKQYNDAAVAEMMIKVLPDIAKSVAQPCPPSTRCPSSAVTPAVCPVFPAMFRC